MALHKVFTGFRHYSSYGTKDTAKVDGCTLETSVPNLALIAEKLSSDQAAGLYSVPPAPSPQFATGRESLKETYFHETTRASDCCCWLLRALRVVAARRAHIFWAGGSELGG